MFFLSPRCLLCDRSCDRRATGRALCSTCERQIQSTRRSKSLDAATEHHPIPVFAWGHYDGALKRSLAQLKYQRGRAIGTWLGQQMAEGWEAEGLHSHQGELIVVPIPMFLAKEKLRGYNQAAVIAAQFAQSAGYRYCPKLLRRNRDTQAQYGIDPRSRSANLESAFSLGLVPKLRPEYQILIVDDIYTTGATVRSALSTLIQQNLTVWGTAVVARPAFH
jgi:ComF family protein